MEGEIIHTAKSDVEVESIQKFLENVSISSDLYWFVRKEDISRCVRRNDRRVLYVQRDEEIGGTCLVWVESPIIRPDEALLRNIAVCEHLRGWGYGHALLNAAIDYAEAEGKETMVAEVVATAQCVSWWKRQGFEERTRRITKAGRPVIVFERDLDPDWIIEDPLKL